MKEIYRTFILNLIYLSSSLLMIDIFNLGRCAFGIDTEVQDDINNTNIYMQKVEEFFSKNFERTLLARIHRISPHIQLAKICSYLLQLKQFFQKKTSTPAQLWLIEHMHEFVQQRFINIEKKKTTDDLLQLMIDAVHSNKVSKFVFFLLN